MAGAYMGRILWVDLTAQRSWVEELPDRVYRDFLGGYGLGVRILWERLRPGQDPLGPENILGFVPGLLTGTGMPFSGRFSVVCKSPLTGGWGDANCGGFWGPEFRRCGYDGLFVVGQAAAPTCLFLHKGEVQFVDATPYWGQDALRTEAALKEQFGKGAQAAVIGQAGESLSLISGIVNDRGRLAARSGVGAVMGSKKLKAVVCKGHLQVPKASPEAFRSSARAVMDRMGPAKQGMTPAWDLVWNKAGDPIIRLVSRATARLNYPTGGPPVVPYFHLVRLMSAYGTTASTAAATEMGDAPVKNWAGVGARDFPWHRSSKLSGPGAARLNVRHYACSACPLHCGAIVELPDGRGGQEEGHRPEYETLAGFGVNLLIDDLEAIAHANEACNRFGLDTISTSAVCAFAFECFEQGLIKPEQCEGHALTWGNARAMLALVDMIGHRRAIGAVLADGVRRAAAQIGGGADRYAMHCGGQELPYHDPRLTPAFATTYVADPTPGRHTAGGLGEPSMGYGPEPIFGKYRVPTPRRYNYQNQGALHAFFGHQRHITQVLGLCQFEEWIGTPLPYTDMVRGASGWNVTDNELLLTGERIQHLRQAFNVREGIRPASWRLPDRVVGRPPLPAGPTKGVTVPVDDLKRQYFAAMTWDPETGKPSRERLLALGLGAVADALHGDAPHPVGVSAGAPPDGPAAGHLPAAAAAPGHGPVAAAATPVLPPAALPAPPAPAVPAGAGAAPAPGVQVTLAGRVGQHGVHWHGRLDIPAPATLGAALAAAGAATGLDLLGALRQGADPVLLVDGNRLDLPEALDTPLAPGAEVAWLTPIGGG